MANEMVDIFDANYKHIGTAEKDVAHRDGLWHQSFFCWIIQPNGKLLFQLRGKHKKAAPNLLDMSAAGHLIAGEAPIWR